MQTLLITIIGPQRNIDLEVPGEVPINELISTLLEISGASSSVLPTAQWSLRIVNESMPLAGTLTLIEAKVVDGNILVLQDAASWTSLRKPDVRFAPKTVAPSASTGGIGVTWNKDDLLP